jgi:hypothetical protein
MCREEEGEPQLKYVVTKRPGEVAKLAECDSDIVPSDVIKKGVDDAWFDMTHIKVAGHVLDVWVDDEGLLKQLPVNFMNPFIMQPIVGPVIVCAGDDEGESIPLTKEVAEVCVQWLNQHSA